MVNGLQPRPVEVQMDNGTWVPGLLHAVHRGDDNTWKGFVRYHERTDAAHLRWFDEGRIRGAPAQG
jgi:hypothetical protein